MHGPGLAESLRRVDGIALQTPIDHEGTVSALTDGAQILITYRWDDRFITDDLQWIQTLSAGLDHFPLEALEARDIRLSSARGAHAPAVAEHAVALLIALVRGIGPAMRDVAERRWEMRPAFELSGRTLGVLGLGSIGEAIAVRAVGLGMKVIGTKLTPDTYQGVADRVYGPDETLEVCQRADAIVICVPHSAATTGLIGATELEALNDGWLVNIGRGSAVDETALVSALANGSLRGAGLDVFEVEPLPLDSVIGSPTGLYSYSSRISVPIGDWANGRH